MTTKVVTQVKSPLRVAMIPDYRSSNPYQALFAEQLEVLGVETSFLQKPARRILPLRASVRNRDVDVLHLHWITPFLRGVSTPTYIAYGLRLLADIASVRASGIPVVWTIHNKISHETPHPKLEMWVRCAIARIVDAMIVHSAEIRREIAVDFHKPLDAFDIVPHPSFGDLYGAAPEAREARQMLGLPADRRVFLHFGLMRQYKGVERLLEAWAQSRLANEGHILLLAGRFGDVEFREKIMIAAKPLTGVRIDEGHVPDDRVRFYFGASDAVVLPFERILTSSSLHLAITFEKPVIAPRIPSVLEVVREADQFLYEQSTDGLCEALRRCAEADLEAEALLIRDSRVKLSDWEQMAKATLEVYERARLHASGRRRSPAPT